MDGHSWLNSGHTDAMCRTLKKSATILWILTVVCLDSFHCKKSGRSKGEGLPKDLCENQVLNATCDAGEVVMMTHARYGRMKISKCVKLDYGHVGCASDVLELSDTRCSGRRKCILPVPDEQFGATKPCPDDLKPYLEAGFKCVKVETPPTDSCRNQQYIHVTRANGYLANLVTEATGCGGIKSPWVIEAKTGQNINIVLFDFNAALRKNGKYAYPHCQMYAVVRERLSTGVRNVTVCGGVSREKVVYTSTTNKVEVSIVKSEENKAMPHFVLQYEAVGCPDYTNLPYSWSVRNGDGIMVKCNFTKDIYHLKCDGRKWVGEIGNCSKAISMGKINPQENDEFAIPYGMSILIVLAIALTIGLFVLFIGLMFLKKRQRGPCGRQTTTESECSRSIDDDKDYVRDAWIRTQHESPSHGLYAKHTPWREPEYSTYATELPPCTPLMARGKNTTIYGQVSGQKLPCGCSAYVDNVDLGDYTTRPQLAALGSGRTEKIVLRPGDHSHYFIYNPENSSACTQDCAAQSSRAAPAHQTDDIKLRLRVTDSPSSGSGNTNPGISPDRKPLMSGADREQHCLCEDYAAICKEKVENEKNDEQQRKPPDGNGKT